MSDDYIFTFIKKSLQKKLIKNLNIDLEFKDKNYEEIINRSVNKILENEIDFSNIEKNKSDSGIKRPHGNTKILENGWKILNTSRFKILNTYINKKNTSIKYECDDGTIVEYCPIFAYNNNREFRKWYDEQKTSDSGVKYDYPQNNGKLPVTWFGLIENQDYFINSGPNYNLWMNQSLSS